MFQGSTRVGEYTLELHTLAAGSGWEKPALKAALRQDLNLEVLMEMACHDDKLTLDSRINLAISLDHLLCNRQNPRGNETSQPMNSNSKPMQLGCTKLSEREKCHSERLWYYFGKPDHFVQQCPLWTRTPSKRDPDESTNTSTCFSMVSLFHLQSHQSSTLPIQIPYSGVVSVLAALTKVPLETSLTKKLWANWTFPFNPCHILCTSMLLTGDP